MNEAELARLALACLDLTSLNPGDTEADVQRLCQRATEAQRRFGAAPAAVCVWPRFAAQARALLPPQIAVAAVANFPDGGTDAAGVRDEVARIVQAGAQELDLVLPWRALAAGDEANCRRVLDLAREAARGLRLKVILETGELRRPALIERAAALALDSGADFLKTSTGTTPIGATPQAAEQLLRTIAHRPDAQRLGFKVSGGVRTLADARTYVERAVRQLGEAALVPARFRIGASGLMGAIEAALGAGWSAPANTGY